jgi:hypothetical protein
MGVWKKIRRRVQCIEKPYVVYYEQHFARPLLGISCKLPPKSSEIEEAEKKRKPRDDREIKTRDRYIKNMPKYGDDRN